MNKEETKCFLFAQVYTSKPNYLQSRNDTTYPNQAAMSEPDLMARIHTSQQKKKYSN